MEKTDRAMARMELGFKQGVNILSIGPNSSPADIMLNAKLLQMPDEERIKEVLFSMLSFIGSIGRRSDETCLLWYESLLRRVFDLKQYDPACNGYQEFMLCLKAIYLCLTFGEAGAEFKFPEFKEEFWKDLMKDWHVGFCAKEPDQKILTFFLNRYALAPKEEKKMMSEIFRQRLTGARAKDVEGWVKWMYAPGAPEAWQFQPEISRHLAIARASAGGRNLLLQDIRGDELPEALNRPEGFPEHLMRALKEVGDQIINIDEAAKDLAKELKESFYLEETAKERIGCIVYDTTFVEIQIFCVCFHPSQIEGDGGRDCQQMVKHARTIIEQKGYAAENGGVLLSGHRVSLLLRVYDVNGCYLMCQGRFPKVK